jgi:hypothetical protein
VLQSARREPLDSIEASSCMLLRAVEWEGKDAMVSVCYWWLCLELCLRGLSSPMPPIVANTTGQEIAVSRQVSPPSASALQPTPMKMFLDKMQVEFLLCRLTAENMLLGRGAVQDTLACRERAKSEIVPLYSCAQDALREQPSSAMALLADLYAAWLRVMDGIAPASMETLSVYIARLNALQRPLTEMKQRLEIAVP